MRVLLYCSSVVRHDSLPQLADEQLVCGPYLVDRSFEDQIFTLRTSGPTPDLSEVASRLSSAQTPEAIACYVDGQTEIFPRNLPTHLGPKVLLVGDPLLSPHGLSRILEHVRTERYDHVILVDSPADEPFFRAAGVTSLFWHPGLFSALHDQTLALLRDRPRLNRVAVSRASWTRHTEVNTALSKLRGGSLALHTLPDDPIWCLEALAQSRLAVETCEHGEISRELLGALGTGTPVLINPIGGSTRLGQLLQQAGCLEVVHSPTAWLDSTRSLLHDASKGQILGEKASRWYDEHLSDAARKAAFSSIVNGGAGHPDFEFPSSAISLKFDQVKNFLPLTSALLECARSSSEPLAFVHPQAAEALKLLTARIPRLRCLSEARPPEGRVWTFFAGRATPPLTPVSGEPMCLWQPRSAASLAMGYVRVKEHPELLFKPQYRAALDAESALRAELEIGSFDQAAEMAKRALTQPRPIEAQLVLADLAAEKREEANLNRAIAAVQALDPNDPRVDRILQRAAKNRSDVPTRQLQATWAKIVAGLITDAEQYVQFILKQTPAYPADMIVRTCLLGAMLREATGSPASATELWRSAALHNPNSALGWFDLGLNLWRVTERREAFEAFRRAHELAPQEKTYAIVFAKVRAEFPDIPVLGPERDLLITGAESNNKHGAGVLLRRYFSACPGVVTMRMATPFKGVEQVGCINLLSSTDLETDSEVETRVRRLLAPFQIRRIVCVPFDHGEFFHAMAAKRVTGAPLCAYVMDDRSVYASSIDSHLASRLYDVADFLLTISSEMQLTYGFKFHRSFDVLPPVVADEECRRVNVWTPKRRPANHCAFVGNVWSHSQFNQLAQFCARTGLKADWFGRDATPECDRLNIFGQGFVSEPELANRLIDYPFVLVPSGELNGREDNEWLTRLSLPSRIVFLLQCGIPVLVIGSPDTCASRFVSRLGIGRIVSIEHPNPRRIIDELIQPATRRQIIENFNAAAPAFVMKNAGAWIWESLEKRQSQPAPFHSYLPPVAALRELWPAA